MQTLPLEKSLTIDELRRNFGEIKKHLSSVTYIITDRGKPIGMLTSTPEMKREKLKSVAGALKDTPLDNDSIWADVLKKQSRSKDSVL